jgi:hypothetical protein
VHLKVVVAQLEEEQEEEPKVVVAVDRQTAREVQAASAAEVHGEVQVL